VHPGRQQLLYQGPAVDKSVLIGTLPNPSPAVAKSLTGYWIGTRVNAPRQATAAVIRISRL
jgi:hypothetical protein